MEPQLRQIYNKYRQDQDHQDHQEQLELLQDQIELYIQQQQDSRKLHKSRKTRQKGDHPNEV